MAPVSDIKSKLSAREQGGIKCEKDPSEQGRAYRVQGRIRALSGVFVLMRQGKDQVREYLSRGDYLFQNEMTGHSEMPGLSRVGTSSAFSRAWQY